MIPKTFPVANGSRASELGSVARHMQDEIPTAGQRAWRHVREAEQSVSYVGPEGKTGRDLRIVLSAAG